MRPEASILKIQEGDGGTRQTLVAMADLVREFFSPPPPWWDLFLDAFMTDYGSSRGGSLASFIDRFLRARMVYTPEPFELLRAPRYLLEQIGALGFFHGDCDDACILAATLARGLGVACVDFVAIKQSWNFEHVFVEILEDGIHWTAIDPTVPFGTQYEFIEQMRVPI